jgi:hypothetical protein
MKRTLTVVIAFLFFLYGNSQTVAPAVMNTSGGVFKSGYYQFDWSIGELALVGDMNSSSPSLIVTNGFIQSHIQYSSVNNSNVMFGNDEIKIFPNPATSYVEINFLTTQRGRITMHFYDGAGKKIYATSDAYHGIGLIKRIPLDKLPNEVYMLQVDLDPYAGYMAKKGAYKVIKIR